MGLAKPVSPTAITVEANMTSNASDKSHSRIAAESARAAGAIQKGYGEGLWFCDGEAVISVRSPRARRAAGTALAPHRYRACKAGILVAAISTKLLLPQIIRSTLSHGI